jgi:hypothetical protein
MLEIGGLSMKKTVLLVLLALLVAAVTAPAVRAVTPLRPAPTPPDTESVLILHGAFNDPGYWWDHTDLTVAVQAHPNVDEESVAAVHQAIADWDHALRQEFGGLITLTDVTPPVHGQAQGRHRAALQPHGGRDGVWRGRDLRGALVSERHRALGSATAHRVHVPTAVSVLRDDA